ncbi:lipid II flippase MurJ [Pseudonocardia eucalypti]|uniref:Lipid II flippase MurJ n=1 Tax=Pseudonocardia eucalypti TaxID=648755 RepID=A0ABP9PQG4_9PSEU|nr:peptidoglycan biosynthesis protein MviN/MurJ (putative lipid II flippase) [Pseudonocardia eucalypti]
MTVVVWTLASRVTGMLRVLLIGALMGPTFFANIFQAGYVLPNTIHHVIAGPVLAGVLIPAIVRAFDSAGRGRAVELLGRISGCILSVAGAGALGLCLLSPAVAWAFTAGVPDAERDRAWQLAVILLLFVAPQIVGYAVVALGVAAQQSQGRFALAAAAPAIENIGTIITVGLAASVYGVGLEVDRAPTGMMIMLGVGTTAAVVVHAGLQLYGAHKVGLLTRPTWGWRRDAEALAALRRVLWSVPVAVCPSVTNFVVTIVAATVPGGVVVVQLSLQMYWALSFLGARAVSIAALPRLASAAGESDPSTYAHALRQGSFFALAASLPSLCLLMTFAGPTANLLANGELRHGDLIGVLGACLTVVAFTQLSGGLYDFGRQALFARLDKHGPALASTIGLIVGTTLAFAMYLLPADGSRIVGLVIAMMFGETVPALVVLMRLRRAIRPEPLTKPAYLRSAGAAVLAMAPVAAAGWLLLHQLRPERIGELAVLVGCGACSLAIYLLVLRATGRKAGLELR